VRDKVDIRLSDASAIQLAKRPIEYDAGFTLLPGKYVIKFLARDAETGRIGTYQTAFVIPNLNKEEKRIPISSVVLFLLQPAGCCFEFLGSPAMASVEKAARQ
jgi:hypothetical protein